MYKKYFKREVSYYTLDILDLDSNDHGVRDHIYSELSNSETDVVIAHVLGIDHAGHSFHISHPELERKIKEIDEQLFNITQSLSPNTTLIMFGDHGMLDEGNHGGATPEERQTILFTYSNH